MAKPQKKIKHTKGEGTLEKRNGIWLARWQYTDEAGRIQRMSRSTGCRIEDRKGAEAKLREFVHPFQAKTEKQIIANQMARITVLEDESVVKDKPTELRFLIDTYIEGIKPKVIAEGSYRVYNGMINTFTGWMKENRDVELTHQVTYDDVVAFLKYLGDKNGISTYNHYISIMRKVFEVAMKCDNNMKTNPWEGHQQIPKIASMRRSFTDTELNNISCALIDESDEMKLLFKLMLFTGLREGDCATLKPNEVDVLGGFIRRLPQKTGKNGVPAIIPIAQEIKKELTARLLTMKKDEEFILPSMAEIYRKGQLATHITGVLKKANIETSIKDEHGKTRIVTGGHAFRHTFASKCAQGRVPIKHVQTMLAHKNADMSLKYQHVMEDELQLPSFDNTAKSVMLDKDVLMLIEANRRGSETVSGFLRRLMTPQVLAIANQAMVEVKSIEVEARQKNMLALSFAS